MKETGFDTNNQDYMAKYIKYIEDELEKFRVEKGIILKTDLLCEEAILTLAEHATDETSFRVRIRRSINGTAIEIRFKGEEIRELTAGGNISYVAKTLDDIDEGIDTGLLILKSNEELVKYSHAGGTNLIRIKVAKGERSALRLTLMTFAASIIIGILCRKFVPEIINVSLCDYFFIPVRTMFINALKIIVGPVVFFSIVTCISQFTNLSELGRIGAKIMGMYTFTTVIAIGVGIGMFYLINPGKWGGAFEDGQISAEVTLNTAVKPSLRDTIINIVPSNLLKPFVESDTIQIIFLAILLGVAVGMIGSYSKVIRDLFDAFNELFLTVTGLIVKLVPLALFSSMFVMIIKTGMDSMVAMLGMAVTEVLGLLYMMLVYCVLIMVIGRLNPITFFRKNLPGMLNAFSLSSSSATMPLNIQICTDKMGISPKVCNFAIPLGATVNMDGLCVHLAVTALFLAKMYAVEIPQSMMFSLVVTIIMLSFGTPAVAGASLVCMGVLLNQIGVPIEAIGLIMGVDSLLDMCRTVSNTTGDMAVTLIVAKMEKLLDVEVYKS